MSDRSTTADSTIEAQGETEIPLGANERALTGWQKQLFFWACALYTAFHIFTLNVAPLETWTFRILHIAGGLFIGFALTSARTLDRNAPAAPMGVLQWLILLASTALMLWALGALAYVGYLLEVDGISSTQLPPWLAKQFGYTLFASVAVATLAGWFLRSPDNRVHWPDWILGFGALMVGAYIVMALGRWQMAAGTPFAGEQELWISAAGVLLILELTRRIAGLALVIITGVFLVYSFVGPWLPGFLEHRGYSFTRFFTYLYTDSGILGPTTAVSSTYIILFITFAAFLQVSRVGDYFVNFAFAVAGWARGGPAKVSIFASGLMGMINGTSAGNVVATGSLTIPLMRKVGYPAKSAGAIEATASTGGQLVPPIMGAGAFIMAEITGIPYVEIVAAAILPAALYFLSVYFMVDNEAAKMGMRGLPRAQLPALGRMLRQVYLFIPILVLIFTLFQGYSVIRAGTVAMISAVVVSWLTPEAMGIRRILRALEMGGRMVIPLVAVCACAGIIVGVISLTGVGTRFSSMLLGVADASMLLAMFFAMCISIMLGMGMPTTAAYAVAASVVAPGLQQLGVEPLVAHFFVFYYAVISAITPPVALAAYAAAGIAGTDPLRTAVTAFKIGLAAFIVPFMFFYSPAILGEGTWTEIARVGVTASVGIFLLAAAVQGWLFGHVPWLLRGVLLAGAISMIYGGIYSDLAGIALGAVLMAWQYRFASRQPLVPSQGG
ncbi:TRAP transporter permease [Halorhodospira halophila]|uniref:TRAP transporter, 4TM/12TM fusion protein n=1 Tax=Halorhodospira halophila (strain DSM 244 / SL1) TaxID=349124 RepID=A1WTZ1_HALHL|nr:TRAP transporter permease [Halorhodospira halophila]ABM61153.1 TRAP transporter, 4TM/12TM fusion protein [Halorhodospira halophila SL1]MBK1729654.1 C4-dicarboxylate ABC transporter permease [Halorhodospira halophila]